jgi:hypothetical protein
VSSQLPLLFYDIARHIVHVLRVDRHDHWQSVLRNYGAYLSPPTPLNPERHDALTTHVMRSLRLVAKAFADFVGGDCGLEVDPLPPFGNYVLRFDLAGRRCLQADPDKLRTLELREELPAVPQSPLPVLPPSNVWVSLSPSTRDSIYQTRSVLISPDSLECEVPLDVYRTGITKANDHGAAYRATKLKQVATSKLPSSQKVQCAMRLACVSPFSPPRTPIKMLIQTRDCWSAGRAGWSEHHPDRDFAAANVRPRRLK